MPVDTHASTMRPSCSARGPAARRARARVRGVGGPRARGSRVAAATRVSSCSRGREVGRPEAMPACAARPPRSLDVRTPRPSRGSRARAAAFEPVLRFELREQLIDEVDVPGPSDLRDHDDVDLCPGGGDGEPVSSRNRGVERVHARPELRRAEVRSRSRSSRALARRDLVLDLDRVFEVRERMSPSSRCPGSSPPCAVAGIEEVDHARGAHRDVVPRLRRADRERLREVAGVAHAASRRRGSLAIQLRSPSRRRSARVRACGGRATDRVRARLPALLSGRRRRGRRPHARVARDC